MNVIGWIFDVLMFPIDWAVTKTVVFAVTAPYDEIFIAIGIATLIGLVIIYTMIPKKQKMVYVAQVIVPYQATEEDEIEARNILIGAQAV